MMALTAEEIVTLPAVVQQGGASVKPKPPPGFVDIDCQFADDVHRVKVGDSPIPFAICPYDGKREWATVDHWSARAREAYSDMQAALADMYAPQRGTLQPDVARILDARPCDPLPTDAGDWGEQDSLENVPRAGTVPP